MLENDAFRSGVAHALDHRSVVHPVGKDNTAWEFSAQSGERCIVGDVTGREHQSAVLTMESGKLILEGEMHSGVPCDVTRTACTMAVDVQSPAIGRDESANSDIRNS